MEVSLNALVASAFVSTNDNERYTMHNYCYFEIEQYQSHSSWIIAIKEPKVYLGVLEQACKTGRDHVKVEVC